MTIEEFKNALDALGITYTPKMLDQLAIYANFLIEYNNHTNLTRITDLNQIYLKHFYDSLTVVKEIDLNTIETLLDLGTGAGFPGMVLKIFFPHLNITLLDSNQKKITFLQELSTKLSINDLNLVHSRVEDYAKTHFESFDLVTSRAVANLLTLSELSLPLVKLNGHFIALKGNILEEPDSTYAINLLGGKIYHQTEFNLPIENSHRTIFHVVKINRTPTNYPRPYDKIIKNPLKKKVK